MAFKDSDIIKLAGSVLAAGVIDSTPSAYYEKRNVNNFIIDPTTIWADLPLMKDFHAANFTEAVQHAVNNPEYFGLIGINPDGTFNDATALRLTPVAGTNNATYIAYNEHNNPASGAQKSWIQPQLLPRPNGAPSAAYQATIWSGPPSQGNRILTSTGNDGNWVSHFWNAAGGLLLIAPDDAPPSASFPSTTLYVTGFVYTGKTNTSTPSTSNHNNLSGRDATNQHPISSITNLESVLEGKVDKEEGKGLSTNDFTDEDKTRLSELSPSKYMGVFQSKQELEDEKPTAEEGSYAIVEDFDNTNINMYRYYNGSWEVVGYKGLRLISIDAADINPIITCGKCYKIPMTSGISRVATLSSNLVNGDWVAISLLEWDSAYNLMTFTINFGDDLLTNGKEDFKEFVIDRPCVIYFTKHEGKWTIVDGVGLDGNSISLESRVHNLEVEIPLLTERIKNLEDTPPVTPPSKRFVILPFSSSRANDGTVTLAGGKTWQDFEFIRFAIARSGYPWSMATQDVDAEFFKTMDYGISRVVLSYTNSSKQFASTTIVFDSNKTAYWSGWGDIAGNKAPSYIVGYLK